MTADTPSTSAKAAATPSSQVPPAPPRPHLIALAWPLLAELLLGFTVGLLGLWLASAGSDESSAAYALANQLQGTFFLLFRIISMGLSVVISQSLGAGNRSAADATARAGLGASSWVGLGTAVVVFAGARPLLEMLQASPPVVQLGVPYLRVLAAAMLVDAFNSNMASVMRAHLLTRDTMYTLLAMHSVHLLLCIPLMRGWGVIPALGLPGFALALLVSRLFGFGVHRWLWKKRLHIHPEWADWWRLRARLLKPMLHIGVPGAAENIAYRIAMLVSVSVVAGWGTQALATQSYAFQISFTVPLVTLAIGFASEILIGHMIGAGQFHQAHHVLRKSLRWGLVAALTLSLCSALAAPWSLQLFSKDVNVIEMAIPLMWMNLALEPGRTCNIIIINALRASGDATFPVAVGAVSMLIVMAGGSWFFGVYLGWGLTGVWLAYTLDEVLRGGIMAWRWFSLGWLPYALRTRRQMRHPRAHTAP